MYKIQMVDVKGQYQKIKKDLDARVIATIESGAFIQGPEVKLFESGLGGLLDNAEVVGCANGTDALQIALMALDLQPGDEVIVPSFTFVASVEVIVLLGMVPVVVDVDPETFLMRTEDIEASLSPKTKAIIPVHLFGQCVDMKSVMAIAEKNNLFVIEDNAQAIGARCADTSGGMKMAGTIGHIGCTSFYPSKNLGCYGDGGAVMSRDAALVQRLKMLANHGMERRYYHDAIGVNSRLDSIQAAILNVKLPHLIRWNTQRQEAAAKYDAQLSGIDQLETPKRAASSEHIFHQYTLRIKEGRRDALQKFLAEKEIPSMIYYPVPMHEQGAYKEVVQCRVPLTHTNTISDEVLSLPMHPDLTDEQIQYICDHIKAFFSA